ncbi:MAG: hypothetical protein R3A79_05500 [Nannocystaceae bacterium]
MDGETRRRLTQSSAGLIPALTPGVLEALEAEGLPTVGERDFGPTGIALGDFAGADAGLVEALYAFLGEVYSRARAIYKGELEAAALASFLKARSFGEVLAPRFAGLGVGIEADGLALGVRQAYHDIRGGSYNALALLLEVVEADEALPGELERVYLLVRDHMKIMRSAVHDLDPEATAADQEILHHRIELLREKWAGAEYTIDGACARIDYRSSFDGSVADCCIEFAALDRVLYNLINNATRFTTDGAVYVRIDPLAEAPAVGPGNVRFAVLNRVSAGQRARLRERFGGDDLRELFVGGFTTGGHGVGLRICADLVVHGYRLPALREAITSGLVGARIIGDCFVAWFHWPGRSRDAG